MKNYYYIQLEIGKTLFWFRSVKWVMLPEPEFNPVFVTNLDLAGLFFPDQIQRLKLIYPDIKIFQKTSTGELTEICKIHA